MARDWCYAHRASFPFIEKVFADGGYAGDAVASATSIAIEIVRRKPDQVGFAVQPRRWVVERFLAWINDLLAKPIPSAGKDSLTMPQHHRAPE